MKKPASRPLRNRGFALVATVSILVLLTLVAVGLLTLSTITTRVGQHGAAQAEARSNARLALTIALGELQKTMGPDSRISARASTLAQHPALEGSVPPASGKAWWVGAAGSDPERGLDPSQPAGPGNPAVRWLISGLDPDTSPAGQIAAPQPFDNPVKMYGDKTIDTAKYTGGQSIDAGSVMIENHRGPGAGGFAYFIDDNGLKAQLAAANSEVRNDREDPPGQGIFPGTYNVGILEGMEALDGTGAEELAKLGSLNDLPLIGGDLNIVREKRLGYTTTSRGVLADVRKGGLKRDLTIAFEREEVFENVFPNNSRGGGFGQEYLVMDDDKYRQSSDLQQNGYIHWEMFKDYYNIKKHIQTTGGRGGSEFLDTILITKASIFNNWNNPFGRGELGPHNIGPDANPSTHRALPYGDYQPIAPPSNTSFYKHSPVVPVMSRFQQNAWIDKLPPAQRGGRERLRTNVQLWTAQYNPYNIGLKVVGDAERYGPRFINYPQVKFTLDGVLVRDRDQPNQTPFTLDDVPGFSGKRQSSIPHSVLLGPGRSHVSAFKDFGTVGRDNDEFLFDDKVRDLTLESIFREYELVSQRGPAQLTVDFVLERPSMLQGSNSNSYSANHEVAQILWHPFAWDAIDGRLPGKRVVESNISARELNENTMISFALNLRTTREPGNSIRPLIDGNIRGLMFNSKWDSPLGLDLLAVYSDANAGEAEEQIFQMNTEDAPKGYTYWGAGQDPLDGHDRVILFDIPREDLVSLGQLQHAGVGRFSYEPSYIVGNSYANLRIPLDNWRASVRDTFSTAERGLADYAIPGSFNLYDASYIVNEELWDSYIFTTIPQIADNQAGPREPSPNDAYFEALLAGEAFLPNPRFLPYEPPGSSFDVDTLQDTGGGRGTTGAFYHNAGHLMVDGAFNVNSTSVDAWEAFLSGTHQLPYQQLSPAGTVTGFSSPEDVEGVRFPRVKAVLGGPMEKGRPDENYWTGFRSLEQEEVRELAEAIVEEINERGPFLTLGDFVNRRLETGEHGERGALQAALDRTVNAGIDSGFEEAAGHPTVPEGSTQGAGFPGQLLQGDILQALSPYMSVRSDTFTIRAYGESRIPGSDEVRARAWCEATVQRFPDPVEDPSASGDALSELVEPSSEFGRSFRITSFRWLSPNEI
jgi:hypothetical protein